MNCEKTDTTEIQTIEQNIRKRFHELCNNNIALLEQEYTSVHIDNFKHFIHRKTTEIATIQKLNDEISIEHDKLTQRINCLEDDANIISQIPEITQILFEHCKKRAELLTKNYIDRINKNNSHPITLSIKHILGENNIHSETISIMKKMLTDKGHLVIIELKNWPTWKALLINPE